MPERIVLIRAVNVGGAKLPMADLRVIAHDLGATEISTYIASGNLLCTPPGDPDEFDRALESAIEQRFGYAREAIGRTPQQLADALAAHPFEVLDERFSHIYFLTGTPAPDKVEAFAAKDFGADQTMVIGADLHIRYAEGVGASKLSAPTIARGLGVTGTGRNLRTIAALLDRAG